MKPSLKERITGCLLGLACGDALGTTLEFSAPGSFAPITDMVGGGPFHLRPGDWTDDTSMALCLAQSLLARNGFDARDQMNRYCNWMNYGQPSSTGKAFDIGNTTRAALLHYEQTGNPMAGSKARHSAGNGSLMRLAPVPLFFFPEVEKAVFYAGESSKTTHGASEAVEACQLFSEYICRALEGRSKRDVLQSEVFVPTEPKIAEIAGGSYRSKKADRIRGSGYVVESLEAALWCFWNSDSYRDAVLMAANLGDDADTTAAICGQLAGAFYGIEAIPLKWRKLLTHHDMILDLAGRLAEKSL
jgi:ADP-ribosyl-[dinitrogen reductase] hydrolase